MWGRACVQGNHTGWAMGHTCLFAFVLTASFMQHWGCTMGSVGHAQTAEVGVGTQRTHSRDSGPAPPGQLSCLQILLDSLTHFPCPGCTHTSKNDTGLG